MQFQAVGAPRSMKLDTILSPWRYDGATGIAKGYPGFAPPSRKHCAESQLGAVWPMVQATSNVGMALIERT
jgi:hypothetical protein